MPDLTVGQAVERLSQIACRSHIAVLTRALRLTLGQRRFTDLVMAAQHHLLTEDMKRVIKSYSTHIAFAEHIDFMDRDSLRGGDD